MKRVSFRDFRAALKLGSLAALFALSSACTRQGASRAPTENEAAAGGIRIGVLPNEKAKDLSLFKTALSKRIKMPVQIIVPSDYSDLVEKFKRGDVDFAFFTALTFLQAEREANAKALLKKVYGNDEFYYSAIIVRADSNIKSVKALKGKKFGFVDKKSTSGYLFPRVMLRKSGLDSGEGLTPGPNVLPHEFFGTHEDAVQALLDKKVDAAGVWADEPSTKQGAWSEGKFKNANLRVLEVSDPIPNDAFVVRQKYYEEHAMVVYNVMEALIGFGDEPEQILKKVFDVDRMATATSRHYDSVRALESLLKEEPSK
jgi:phosphonate transport system substrate-binding protein